MANELNLKIHGMSGDTKTGLKKTLDCAIDKVSNLVWNGGDTQLMFQDVASETCRETSSRTQLDESVRMTMM